MQRGEPHVATEAEIGVMYLHAKKCQELQTTLEAERMTWNRCSLRDLKVQGPHGTLIQTLVSRTTRE